MSSIRVENLRKEFNHGAVVAVRDLNITFEEGTTTCLLGPSGCGKTTLMRIIATLLIRTDRLDASAIHGRPDARVALLQSPILPTAPTRNQRLQNLKI